MPPGSGPRDRLGRWTSFVHNFGADIDLSSVSTIRDERLNELDGAVFDSDTEANVYDLVSPSHFDPEEAVWVSSLTISTRPFDYGDHVPDGADHLAYVLDADGQVVWSGYSTEDGLMGEDDLLISYEEAVFPDGWRDSELITSECDRSLEWLMAGIPVTEERKWTDSGYPLGEALRWKELGANPRLADQAREYGISPNDDVASDLVRAISREGTGTPMPGSILERVHLVGRNQRIALLEDHFDTVPPLISDAGLRGLVSSETFETESDPNLTVYLSRRTAIAVLFADHAPEGVYGSTIVEGRSFSDGSYYLGTPLSPEDVAHIHGETGIPHRTIRKWGAGFGGFADEIIRDPALATSSYDEAFDVLLDTNKRISASVRTLSPYNPRRKTVEAVDQMTRAIAGSHQARTANKPYTRPSGPVALATNHPDRWKAETHSTHPALAGTTIPPTDKTGSELSAYVAGYVSAAEAIADKREPSDLLYNPIRPGYDVDRSSQTYDANAEGRAIALENILGYRR